MKFTKFSAGLCATVLIFMLIPAITASAEPFAEIKIAPNVQSVIKAVEFDSNPDYNWKPDCDGGKGVRPDELVDTETGAGVAEDFDGNIGWTDHGTWVQWTVNVEADGDYRFEAWCASDNGSNEGLSLLYDDAPIGSIDHVEQEGWQEYSLYKFGDIAMTAGTHVIKAEWPAVGGFNITAIIVTPLVNGYPLWIPVEHKIASSGTNRIGAVDFDPGVNGFSFDEGGASAVRPDEKVNTEFGNETSGATYSGYTGNIGWISAGDWVQYTVSVAREGMYNFETWLASDADPTGGIKVYVGENEIGTSPDSAKDGWQSYAKYPVGEAAMAAGDYVIKVEFTGGCNFAALEITRTGNIPEEAPPATEAEAPAKGDETDAAATGEGDSNTAVDEEESGSNLVLIIIIAAAIVVVVVVIVVIMVAGKGKKAKE
ncbi:MAG: carbohydrate-binding protein [Oscillospiraceae bacterium]|nr:carbohydrate-binding protein [Oscillospiraceae bacterium]